MAFWVWGYTYIMPEAPEEPDAAAPVALPTAAPAAPAEQQGAWAGEDKKRQRDEDASDTQRELAAAPAAALVAAEEGNTGQVALGFTVARAASSEGGWLGSTVPPAPVPAPAA